MISDGNQQRDRGRRAVVHPRRQASPRSPTSCTEWRREHPGRADPDGQILTQPWPAGPRDQRRDQVIYYQYRADRARRTLRGIDEQVAKAERAVAGKAPVKRNRFIRLVGADKSVNRDLEAKARALAGWKGYITNLPDPDPEFVIGAYHRLFQIEASFRMSKHDLAARPIYHHKRESIDAHLTIVFAALAVSRLVEDRTGWSIRRFVRTARRYRTVQIRAGQQLLTAEDPLPADLRDALASSTDRPGALIWPKSGRGRAPGRRVAGPQQAIMLARVRAAAADVGWLRTRGPHQPGMSVLHRHREGRLRRHPQRRSTPLV